MKNDLIEMSKSKMIPIKSIIGYSILAIISGMSGFAFITVINKVISMSINPEIPQDDNYLYMFIAAIAVFFVTRRWLSEGVISLSQRIFCNMRKDVMKLVIKAPYRSLQESKDQIYATLTSDVHSITNASLSVITFFSSIILIIASFVYMAYLSLSLFGLSIGIIAVGVGIYLLRSRKSDKLLKEARELEGDFMKTFNSIMEGSKEINVNLDKGFGIYNEKLVTIVDKGEKTYTKAFVHYVNSELVSQILFYGLITFVLIYSGSLLDLPIDITISFVLILLYLLGPIVSVMTLMPSMNQAKVSLGKMNKLKRDLQQMEYNDGIEDKEKGKFYDFNVFGLKDYSFSYGEDKFSVGPIDLTINRNDVIFIHGGNGAGKTTFINTVLRLYDLDKGDAYIDGHVVAEENIDSIKELFSPVFSDFYLFDEFYGIKNVDVEKVNYFLRLFELEEKVTLKDGKFSSIDLSTGQRKRLALISSLIEDRPILVLDEWAADQDPYFRHKFYTEIIPEIVREHDKTVIAITHDDKYYDQADRLLKMEYGTLVEFQKQELEPMFSSMSLS
ncbi:cyclic peptide export ABC transporter [uncultured Dokdonia sp.]|uniref:cyclic peptide export ABC transporter n=1 Tax=uncultured Dokdonia sp. TaxID=575653 RepID=UPI002607A2F7|nr:cyclic peptide export ABC transporter [uncultured Dokdonia sp.]